MSAVAPDVEHSLALDPLDWQQGQPRVQRSRISPSFRVVPEKVAMDVGTTELLQCGGALGVAAAVGRGGGRDGGGVGS